MYIRIFKSPQKRLNFTIYGEKRKINKISHFQALLKILFEYVKKTCIGDLVRIKFLESAFSRKHLQKMAILETQAI